MNKTKIEWADYTWNPIKGLCPMGCSYCYARRMYKRFKWNTSLRINYPELDAPLKIKKPSKIFLGSMIDMYHPKVCRVDWMGMILSVSLDAYWHTYITLTKLPIYLDISPMVFPSHWWVGASADGNYYGKHDAIPKWLRENKQIQGKRFISFEPLLGPCECFNLQGIDWIIIGGLTPKPVHKKEWIDRLVAKADELNIPVFIKDNAHYPIVRREFPEERR